MLKLKSFILNVTLCGAALISLLGCVSSSSKPVSINRNVSRCDPGDLQKQIVKIAGGIDDSVGADVQLLETGENVTVNSDRHFPMQSVYKLPIAMAVLKQIDQGSLKFDQKVEVKPKDFVSAGQRSPLRDANPHGTETTVNDLLALMVSESDGTACDVLLDLLGGPTKVTEYLRDLGINEIVVATSEKAMGLDQQIQYRNWATPSALIQLLKLLHEGRGISKTNREILLSLMTKTTTHPQRIKGLLPPGTSVAHRTGSSGTAKGLTRATNDVGIVSLPNERHLAIAVLISETRADERSRDDIIAKISRAAYDCFSTQTTR